MYREKRRQVDGLELTYLQLSFHTLVSLLESDSVSNSSEVNSESEGRVMSSAIGRKKAGDPSFSSWHMGLGRQSCLTWFGDFLR